MSLRIDHQAAYSPSLPRIVSGAGQGLLKQNKTDIAINNAIDNLNANGLIDKIKDLAKERDKALKGNNSRQAQDIWNKMVILKEEVMPIVSRIENTKTVDIQEGAVDAGIDKIQLVTKLYELRDEAKQVRKEMLRIHKILQNYDERIFEIVDRIQKIESIQLIA